MVGTGDTGGWLGTGDQARPMVLKNGVGTGFDGRTEQIHDVVDPTAPQDVATMGFVMATAAGMEWQDSVLSYQNDPPGPPPVIGDRYLIGTPTVPNAWTGHDNEITEWNGVGWDFYAPSPGWVVMQDDTQDVWLWSGAAWVDFFSAYFKIDGSKAMAGSLDVDGNSVTRAGTIVSKTNTAIDIQTLDNNKDVSISPHGSGKLKSNTLQSKAGAALVISTEDTNKNIQVTPNGTGVLEPTKSQDMTGGNGFWFRPPSMTTVQATAMVVGWGASDAGKMWYDTTTNQFMGWNGAAAVILG